MNGERQTQTLTARHARNLGNPLDEQITRDPEGA
jgi:hypothetical protein